VLSNLRSSFEKSIVTDDGNEKKKKKNMEKNNKRYKKCSLKNT